MVILIAPDKFKGSLSAVEVCEAIREGILSKNSKITIETVPLADGGEGTLEVLTKNSGGSLIQKTVAGPLFSPVNAVYGISGDGETAFIEMAKASGLQLLKAEERNPLKTTTLGTGELILDALNRGVRKIILGIGGSATNDAGVGMASALGFEFLDEMGNKIAFTGEGLSTLYYIKSERAHPKLQKTAFITLCDVDNPLIGPQGAAFIYGPQKGASREMVSALDNGLSNFKIVVAKTFNVEADFPGAGAAGGLGAGAKIFLNSKIVRGMDYILAATSLQEKIKHADLIITGEGKLDSQTLSGKVIAEVAKHSGNAGKKVVVICGQNELSAEEIRQLGISQLIVLADDQTKADEAMKNSFELIRRKISSELNLLSKSVN